MAAANDDATTMEDLLPDLISSALRHMDGPTLASASCSSAAIRALASDPALWRRLCHSAWPSLAHPRLLSLLSGSPGAHRRFFSRSFPFPEGGEGDINPSGNLPTELVSAVDLYHKGVPVFSRVVETETSSSSFLASPFRVDLLGRKDPGAPDEPAMSPEDLTLSWVAIDPDTRLAVNLSSRRPVSVDRHWLSGETIVKFGVVLRGCAASVVVTCGKEAGHVREVSLTVEDMEGRAMEGRGSLGVLKGAMEGGRRGVKWGNEVKGEYEEYSRGVEERRARKGRRDGIVDLLRTAFGSSLFLSLMMLLAFR